MRDEIDPAKVLMALYKFRTDETLNEPPNSTDADLAILEGYMAILMLRKFKKDSEAKK